MLSRNRGVPESMVQAHKSNYPKDQSSAITQGFLGGKTARSWYVVVLVGVFFFFLGLGSFGLIGPDEPRYAQVAREMQRSGDWLIPRIGGNPWLEKPPLLYWTMAVAMRGFGVNELSARLPSALSALILVGVILAVVQRLRPGPTGLLTAVIFSTSTMVVSFAHAATTDMLLSASLGVCLLLFFLAQDPGRPGAATMLVIFYAFVGVALLAKGLIGGLIPGLVLLGFALASRGSDRKIRLGLFPGVLITIIVAGVWYVPVTVSQGWSFIDQFILSHHFQRFLSNKFHHPGPFYYYLPVLLVGAFPWSALLISSAAQIRLGLGRSTEPTDRLRRYCWIWVLVPTLFFSFSGSKLPGYILPVFPAIALLIALELDDLLKERASRWTEFACLATPAWMLAVGLSGILYLRYHLGIPLNALVAGGMLLLALSAALFFCLRRRRHSYFVGGIVGAAALIVVFVNLWVMPVLAKRESMRETATFLLSRMPRDELIVGYFLFPHGLTFYTDARSLYDSMGEPEIYTNPASLVELVNQRQSIVIVTSPGVWPAIESDSRFSVEMLRQDADYVFVRLRARIR